MQSVSKEAEQLEHSYIVDGCIKCTPLEKILMISYKISIHLAYDPKIPLLDIYPREMKIYTHKDFFYI